MLLATVTTSKQLAPGVVLAGTAVVAVMAAVSTPPTPLLAPRRGPSGGESTALVMQRMPPCVVIVAAADVNATPAAPPPPPAWAPFRLPSTPSLPLVFTESAPSKPLVGIKATDPAAMPPPLSQETIRSCHRQQRRKAHRGPDYRLRSCLTNYPSQLLGLHRG